MDRKTRRRVGALRRLLAKRERERTRYLQRNEPEKDTNIEQEIATLRRVTTYWPGKGLTERGVRWNSKRVIGFE